MCIPMCAAQHFFNSLDGVIICDMGFMVVLWGSLLGLYN